MMHVKNYVNLSLASDMMHGMIKVCDTNLCNRHLTCIIHVCAQKNNYNVRVHDIVHIITSRVSIRKKQIGRPMR